MVGARAVVLGARAPWLHEPRVFRDTFERPQRGWAPLTRTIRVKRAHPPRAPREVVRKPPAQAETVDGRCTPCSAVAVSISSNHAWCSRLTRHASSMSPAAMASTIG